MLDGPYRVAVREVLEVKAGAVGRETLAVDSKLNLLAVAIELPSSMVVRVVRVVVVVVVGVVVVVAVCRRLHGRLYNNNGLLVGLRRVAL